jgi:ketosteroid isomerase-like protein
VLEKQRDDWNRGDVRAYMEGYAPDTVFVGAEVTRGVGPVLERYLKKYPNREAMGTLAFSEIEVRMLGAEYASVIGRWALTRSAAGGGNTGGRFTLLLKKTAAGWKVILDHTS